MKNEQILLVGNYPPDGQESMLRFGRLLLGALRERGCQVHLIQPAPVFGRLARGPFARKWLGYLDKLVLFPLQLRREARRLPAGSVIHICDHSNAVYTSFLKERVLITCHDLLAVRGALGEETDCPASLTGRLLQRWILAGLGRASLLACVSEATRRDVERLVAGGGAKGRVVRLGFNAPFSVLPAAERDRRLAGRVRGPYLLHVGSNLRRKNREGVLRVFAALAGKWEGSLVFAGAPLNASLRAQATALGISERIVELPKPDDATLEALYNGAFALLFPSRFEGFGWPIIEAQACGCPVVCSDSGPLPDVAGAAGLVCPLEDEEAMARAILMLTDPAQRALYVQRGLKNVERFATGKMIGNYLALYEELSGAAKRTP